MPLRERIIAYGSPIIEGITPYSLTRLETPTLRTDWPPYRDQDRLDRYDEFEALIENRAADVFDDLQLRADQKSKIVLAAALPELLCNVWADAVYGDSPPEVELPSDALGDRWAIIDDANDFSESAAWESVFAAAGFGHSILRLYRDEERAAANRLETDVVIEEIDPAIFFPLLRRGSAREIEAVTLAWAEDRADPFAERQEIWQVAEHHYLEDGAYVIERRERREASGLVSNDWRRVSLERPSGVDFLPFVDMHASRWRGRYWGVSELSRSISLFDEVDNTLSNIAEILEYHGKPMLQVPASSLFGGVLTKGADKTLGIRKPEDANIARYITYDGQITSQLSNLDKLVELVMLTNEVPRTYFGLGESVAAPSGTSLKLQLQNYMKKANRWQRREKKRLRTLIPMALRLDGKASGDKLIPDVNTGSPLPADEEQEVRIITGAVTGGLMSKKSAIRVLKRLGYVDDVDEELSEIEDEKEASIAALPPAMRNPGVPAEEDANSATNPSGGEEPPA